MGPNTCVPLTCLCKKQGAVSHSSSEAESIALDACLRLEGISVLSLWDERIDKLVPRTQEDLREAHKRRDKRKTTKAPTIHEYLESCDYVIP